MSKLISSHLFFQFKYCARLEGKLNKTTWWSTLLTHRWLFRLASSWYRRNVRSYEYDGRKHYRYSLPLQGHWMRWKSSCTIPEQLTLSKTLSLVTPVLWYQAISNNISSNELLQSTRVNLNKVNEKYPQCWLWRWSEKIPTIY